MKTRIFVSLLTASLIFFSCGNNDGETDEASRSAEQEQGLTEFELEHGVGPVTERVDIDDTIDAEMATKGLNIYEMKCEMCHNMEGRMVGPALGDVLERRSPEFVMNFILNPSGMVQEHPEGQRLLQEYMTAMPYQNVKEDEARAIVEFLRDYNQNQ